MRHLIIFLAGFLLFSTNLLAEGKEKLSSVIIEGEDKFVFSYNDKGQCTSKTEFNWNSSKEKWEIHDEIVYNYNNGLLMSDKKLILNKEGSELINGYKKKFTYTKKGQKKSKVSFKWDPNADKWINRSKEVYSYNEDGKKSKMLYYRWQDGEKKWGKSAKTTFVYNAEDDLIQKNKFGWEESEKSWSAESKRKYTLDQDGNVLKELTVTKMRWGKEKGKWLHTRKYEKKYNENGNLISSILFRKRSSKSDWKPLRKIEYTYVKDGKKKKELMYRYSQKKFVMVSKSEYTYHPDDQNNELILPFVEGSDGSDFGVEEGKPKEYIRYRKPSENEDWQAEGKMIFKWSKL